MSKARITYRYNNEIQERFPKRDSNQSEQVELSPSKVIPLYQENPDFIARDYGEWRSPFDAETERIEQLIRNAEESRQPVEPNMNEEAPTYYTAAQAEKTFQNVNFYDEQPVRATYRKKGKNTNWFSVTTAITGAILTGIILGMFVLSIFRGEANPLPSSNEQATIDNGLAAVLNDPDGTKLNAAVVDKALAGDATNDPNSLAAVIIPEQTYFLIQNGVFSNLEGANTAVQLLNDRGLSGAVSQGEQFSVFAGAAVDREEALLLSHYLQNEALEVFIKPYVLPAVQQLSWAGENSAQLQGYMDSSRSLVDLILGMTATGLQDINESSLPAPDKQLVLQEHKLWTEAANQLSEDAPEDVKAIVQEMNKSLNKAVLTIEQYDKNPTESFLWQIQAAVAEHIIAQKRFIDVSMMQ